MLSPSVAGGTYFADLQHLTAASTLHTMPVLARLLSDTLLELHLQIADARAPNCGRCSGFGDSSNPLPQKAVGPPLTQLFSTECKTRLCNALTPAACAARFPNLRKLKLQYERGPDSAAELTVLRSLPTLKVLWIGP
jgi:hypothetical protein